MKLAAVAAGIAAFAVVIASYVIARTPNDTVGSVIAPAGVAASTAETVNYTLPAGRSASQIGDDLQKLGVVRSGRQFEALVSLMGMGARLSAGDYVLNRNTTAATVIEQITVKNRVPTVRVTFPEGIRIEEMAVIAETAGFGSRQLFLDAVTAAKLPEEFAADLPAGQGLQGYLFPDTYIMPVGSTPAQLVELMIKTFALRFSPDLRTAARAHGITLHQAVTLAAIVEREAAIPAERPLIAAVFYNRIAANDLIGADPTVQFAVSSDPASVAKYGWWKKELTLEDLQNPSPYNTRLRPGIPPGPITNPGLASLQAVAHPTQTKLYYFVADAKKNDGSHVFAETFAEHERNISRVGSP